MNDSSVKIADFGLSKKSFKGLHNKTVVGTPLYMSLQLLMAAPYSSKCDIWSLGCVFYEVINFLYRCYMEKLLGQQTVSTN